MASGKYDTVISIQRQSITDNGQELVRAGDWSDHLQDAPAAFMPNLGDEKLSSGDNSAFAPALFCIRYNPDIWPILESDSILHNQLRYYINSVKWDARTNSDIYIEATRRGMAINE